MYRILVYISDIFSKYSRTLWRANVRVPHSGPSSTRERRTANNSVLFWRARNIHVSHVILHFPMQQHSSSMDAFRFAGLQRSSDRRSDFLFTKQSPSCECQPNDTNQSLQSLQDCALQRESVFVKVNKCHHHYQHLYSCISLQWLNVFIRCSRAQIVNAAELSLTSSW